jgi:hypothetical protein
MAKCEHQIISKKRRRRRKGERKSRKQGKGNE